MPTTTLKANGHTIELGHADKVLFPDAGLTKADLADYYQRIAEVMLPHLKGRPVTMQRFPDGIEAEGFYQKKASDYFPSWIRRVTVEVEGRGENQPQVVCENTATLLYLVDQACITPHVWLSRAGALHHPDRLVFDLDPPSEDFEPVRFAARRLRDLLEDLGLESSVMTTGSQGDRKSVV